MNFISQVIVLKTSADFLFVRCLSMFRLDALEHIHIERKLVLVR